MAFVYKTVKKDDANFQKYLQIEKRYVDEINKEIMARHNYLYNHNMDRYVANFYEEISSNCSVVYVVANDEKAIYLVLIHVDNVSFDYDTPMAWVLFVDNQMILMNCDYNDEMGVLDNGERWLRESYLVEPLVLPNMIRDLEDTIKQIIIEALTIYSKRGAAKLTFSVIHTEVIFDQPYVFRGYNN